MRWKSIRNEKKEKNIRGNLASMCMKTWSLFFKMDSHLSTDPHVVPEKNHHNLPHYFYHYFHHHHYIHYFWGVSMFWWNLVMFLHSIFSKPIKAMQWCIAAPSFLLGEGFHLRDPRVIERTERAERVQWSPMVVHAFDNGFRSQCFH